MPHYNKTNSGKFNLTLKCVFLANGILQTHNRILGWTYLNLQVLTGPGEQSQRGPEQRLGCKGNPWGVTAGAAGKARGSVSNPQ